METRKKINDIRELISKNEIADALTKMRQLLSDNSELNDVLLLSSQLNDIKRRILLNLIDYKEYAQFESRITSAILEMLNTFEKSGINPISAQNAGDTTVLQELLELLDMTHQAFGAQARVRDKLYATIVKRLNIKEFLEFEDFFALYFNAMTDNERLLHQTIRGYTEDILKEYNIQVLELLRQNPHLKEALPNLKRLEKQRYCPLPPICQI